MGVAFVIEENGFRHRRGMAFVVVVVKVAFVVIRWWQSLLSKVAFVIGVAVVVVGECFAFVVWG